MQLKQFQFRPTYLDRIKTLTEELTADQEAVNMFFKVSQDLLIVANKEGDILTVNDAWTNKFGYEKSETVGSRIFEYVHPEDVQSFIKEWHHLSDKDWDRQDFRVLTNRKEECATLEWNATLHGNGQVYVIAREVPTSFTICPKSSKKIKIKRSR